MPRQINYQEVARNIARYMVAHPNRVSAKTFCEALSRWLNNTESKKLLEYYINVERVLQPVTQKHYRFTCHQEHFNPDAVRDIFLKYDIQSHFGKAKKAEVVIVKTPAPVKEEPVVEEAPVASLTLAFTAPAELSDESLKAAIEIYTEELHRREEERRKKAKRMEILRAIKEMVESEGETWEEILAMDKI